MGIFDPDFLLLSLLLQLLSATSRIHCLNITRFTVPPKAVVGEGVWLNCSYDLGSHSLYSVKWYKDSEEIYRFLPLDKQTTTIFESEGLRLDPSKSQNGNIYVLITDPRSKGDFRCEVSIEAPTFQTARRNKSMRVYRSHEEAASFALRLARTPFVHSSLLIIISCLVLLITPPSL